MTKTQRYFHPLQSKKFKEGMERIRANQKRKRFIKLTKEINKLPTIHELIDEAIEEGRLVYVECDK